jgi:RelA/SpoT family (p)ppGpp synthetase
MRVTTLANEPRRGPLAIPDAIHKEPADMAVKGQRASLRRLLQLCATYMPPGDLELIRSAYKVAEAAHRGARRKSGEAFIEHPIAVARILAELALDAHGIAAALLHDTVEDTSLTIEEVRARFGSGIADIVDGVTKFTAMESAEPGSLMPPLAAEGLAPAALDGRAARERKQRQRMETVRKLFLAMSQDPRVVLLKLADRLHNMRTLSSMSPAQRENTARETLDIFAPLAGRVGLHLVKTELEDLAFSYLEPEAYAHTVQRLSEEAERRTDWAVRMCATMQHELAARGITATVNWRVKRPYRAYHEAGESRTALSQLHDLIAFRVLVSSKDDCYKALGAIHHLWHPHDNRIRDYIANPKVNGYQSLHTGVFALDAQLAQIHIRTHEMHRAAQHGVATYWLERAATGQRVDGSVPIRAEDMLGWVTQLATWHRELKLSAAEFVATLRGDLFDEQIFVFTPKGEIRELPQGSTVLDFAYQIHTQIGDHAARARVQTNASDGTLLTMDAPITYQLKSGDVVQVVTRADIWPQAEWRDLVRTHYAREKLMRTLRAMQKGAASGDSAHRDGDGGAGAGVPLVEPLRHPGGKSAVVELARCCYPCPGDAISGVVGRGRRISIHRCRPCWPTGRPGATRRPRRCPSPGRRSSRSCTACIWRSRGRITRVSCTRSPPVRHSWV